MRARVGTCSFFLAVGAAAPAGAAVLEGEANAAVTVAAATGEAAEPLTYRAGAAWSGRALFENQVEVGVRLGAALERDHPARDPLGGRDLEAGSAFGPVSGFGGGAAKSGPRARVETAFAYVRGPWAEVSIGRDEGVAARYTLSAPVALPDVLGADARLDPSGLGVAIVRNELSGRSEKLSVESERLFGVKIGYSFSPRGEGDGLDRSFAARDGGFEMRNAHEAALSFSHGLGRTDVAVGATRLAAEGARGFGDLESFGVSARLKRGPLAVGAAYLRSDNARPDGDAGYEAVSAGAMWETDAWKASLGIQRMRDSLTDVSVNGAHVAAARRWRGWDIGAALDWRERDALLSTQSDAKRDIRDTPGALFIARWSS